jgi:hypothetical protein
MIGLVATSSGTFLWSSPWLASFQEEAQAVGDHPGEDLIILHRREFKGFQAQIAFAVKAQGCCCLHVYHLIPFIFRMTAAKSWVNLLK